jgi:hypothetical protein
MPFVSLYTAAGLPNINIEERTSYLHGRAGMGGFMLSEGGATQPKIPMGNIHLPNLLVKVLIDN